MVGAELAGADKTANKAVSADLHTKFAVWMTR